MRSWEQPEFVMAAGVRALLFSKTFENKWRRHNDSAWFLVLSVQMRIIAKYVALALLIWQPLFSQAKGKDTTGFFFLQEEEKKLALLAPLITSGETDSLRSATALHLYKRLDSLLRIPSGYYFPFDSLKEKTVSILRSPDDKFRIFTFNQISTNGDFRNFGLLQMADDEHSVFSFLDTLKKPKPDYLNAELEITDWYGALYYSIVPFKKNGMKMYLLLGFDGSTIHSNKKILDVLWFDNGEPIFGKDIFKNSQFDRKPTSRVVYEFHNNCLMLVHYAEKEKIVVLDKLIPAFPEVSNNFYYYIPSGDYDGYKYTKGFWIKSNLEDLNLGQGDQENKPTSLPTPDKDPQNE
jgi:hypothetical protein